MVDPKRLSLHLPIKQITKLSSSHLPLPRCTLATPVVPTKWFGRHPSYSRHHWRCYPRSGRANVFVTLRSSIARPSHFLGHFLLEKFPRSPPPPPHHHLNPFSIDRDPNSILLSECYQLEGYDNYCHLIICLLRI